MNIQFKDFSKIKFYFSLFYPEMNTEKLELTQNNASKVIIQLVYIIDALLKGENYYKKRNFSVYENQDLFTGDVVKVMKNINYFLARFNTTIFDFTKTERQTFIFIIENVMEYLAEIEAFVSKKDRTSRFADYRFWIEHLFNIFDQNISGTIYSSKKINIKTIFTPDGSVKNELIFSNTSSSFSLFPFVINKGDHYYFLIELSRSDLIYSNPEVAKKFKIMNKNYNLKVCEFLLANMDFRSGDILKNRLTDEAGRFLKNYATIEEAYGYYKKKMFLESLNVIKELSIEAVNLPLIYLLQIKNMTNLNRNIEAKRLLQKFILFFPYYIDGYEILADIYFKEEHYDLALSFYEKALKLNQKNNISAKLKKVKEKLAQGKGAVEKTKNEYFYDVIEAMLQKEENVLGRNKELRQMLEILISRSKRNIMLIGESGIGKTAMIRLLAKSIVEGSVPEELKDKKIKEINFVTLLTGSKYRGQFEEKVLKILNDFKQQNSILVLEDIHLMMSTGTARGTSVDFVNIMKQFLKENSIQVIATTNYEDFKNEVEKDNALLSFFQKIKLNELSLQLNSDILKDLAAFTFNTESIIFPEDLIEDVIESAKRNLKGKKLPDSAIMIFERSVSKVKLKHYLGEREQLKVTREDIREVFSDILNLPGSSIPISIKKRLFTLKDRVLEKIIGQESAIDRMVSTIITSKLNFNVKRARPDGVFLFIGPTGVGKTESAIALANSLYGTEDYLIRIDMSEYMEKFTYSRFVGAAPGYVGYNDSNQLTDKVRQNPFSIILLDEIEKADSQLLNIFLQVFDAGRLTDARGNEIDFSNTTIIMTSNIGTSLFSKTQMGYQGELNNPRVSKASLVKSLKKYFSPEFLNRIDEIVVFKHLKNDDIRKIIETQLKETRELLCKNKKDLVLEDEVVEFLVAKGYSNEYGARNMSRAIKHYLLEKLADVSFKKGWDDCRHLVCSLEKEEIVVSLYSENSEILNSSTYLQKENRK